MDCMKEAQVAHRTPCKRGPKREEGPLKSIVGSLKPNSTLLAYALFLATNAMSIWGGVFPFLPLDFQTQSLLFWFFLAQATFFSLTFFAVGLGAYRNPDLTRRVIPFVAAGPYFIGWSFLIAAIYAHGAEVSLTAAGGMFLGAGSAGFYLLFQRLFVAQEPNYGMRSLILGSAYAAVLYFALYLIPRAVTVYLVPLVFMPLFSLSLVLSSRRIDRNQPMFTDTPRKHPRVYRRAWRVFWRSALCMASLGFCTGMMRAMAIDKPIVGSYVNVLSMAALLGAALTLLALWRTKNLRLNVMAIYRILFPIIITALALLAFLPVGYTQWLAAGLYAIYSLAILLLMLQAGQASRDYGVNPLFLFGLMGALVFMLHDLGFIAGSALEVIGLGTALPLSTPATALVTVWLLAGVYFVTHNRLHETIASAFSDNSIELLRLPQGDETSQSDKASAANAKGTGGGKSASPQLDRTRPDRRKDDPPRRQRDRIGLQVEKLRQAYGLSAREAEVVEQIVRGKTAARIAEDLYVSKNTISTHTRRIYAKLGIHKKLELVDLVETL